jgi:hypothetical protein
MSLNRYARRSNGRTCIFYFSVSSRKSVKSKVYQASLARDSVSCLLLCRLRRLGRTSHYTKVESLSNLKSIKSKVPNGSSTLAKRCPKKTNREKHRAKPNVFRSTTHQIFSINPWSIVKIVLPLRRFGEVAQPVRACDS